MSTPTSPTRPRFDDPLLHRVLMDFRRVDSRASIHAIAKEYMCICAVIATSVIFAESRAGWGLSWAWNIPVFALAVALIGALQHRLAGLAHEASHYTLLENKFANDLVADLFCLFPILSTIHFYRLFHMAHHQYTNDPERDPDLLNMGRSKKVDDFPMTRIQFFKAFPGRLFFAPVSFAQYLWDYIYVNVFGKGGSPYVGRTASTGGGSKLRLGSILGLIHLLGVNLGLWVLTASNRAEWILPFGAVAIAIGLIGPWLLPDRSIFQSPFREPYSPRFASMMRLTFLTLLMLGLARLRHATGGASAVYVFLLWVLPMSTSFMFYMLLRDVYQHANADRGRLTNSRVFFVDAWTKWAVFVYGQDMHVPHHLFPAIPHYRLPALHEYLRTNHREYAEHVVECRGTIANEGEGPTILDVLTTINPSDGEARHHSAHPAPRPNRLAISEDKSFTTQND